MTIFRAKNGFLFFTKFPVFLAFFVFGHTIFTMFLASYVLHFCFSNVLLQIQHNTSQHSTALPTTSNFIINC